MQPDDVVATSGPSNVSAMGLLPVMVLWRGLTPLQRGEYCGFRRQKNGKKERNSRWRQAAGQPGVRTRVVFHTCVIHQNPVKIRIIKSLTAMLSRKKDDGGGGRWWGRKRREVIDATAYMQCHFAPVPDSRGDVTGQLGYSPSGSSKTLQ